MGSKKHKLKEKDPESRKRKHRSRSPSGSEEQEHKKHRKHKKKKSHKESKKTKELLRELSLSPISLPDSEEEVVVPPAPIIPPPPPMIRTNVPESQAPPQISKKKAPEISLSIEETNRLRAKLGLKPLEVKKASFKQEEESVKDQEEGEITYPSSQDDFVHRPPENIGEKKKAAKMREKIKEHREKRKIKNKLSKVKGLANDSDEDESTAAWVIKNRKVQKEKAEAEKRAKILEELDAEFGVGSLVEDEMKQERSHAYSSKHLSGLTIQHDQTRFIEGRDVILTLQDRAVLDEGSDVLVNVNMMDDERYRKNTENKKKKPGYSAYDEDIDEDGNFNIMHRKILSKYDEEIDGQKKKSFVIGTGGRAENNEEKLERVRNKLMQKRGETLDLPNLQLATEYYTQEEMSTQFKKVRKKVRKIRKKPKVLKADDLLPLEDGDPNGTVNSHEDVPCVKTETLDEDDIVPDENLTGMTVDEDTAEQELQMALEKARKLKTKDAPTGLEELAARIKLEPKTEPGTSEKTNITLNSTAEFCRALGDIPTYGMAGNREQLMDFDADFLEDRAPEEDYQLKGAWNEVGIDETPAPLTTDEMPILEEEPDAGQGLAGALSLAIQKGYLEKEEKKKKAGTGMQHLVAQNYSIEDKSNFKDDDRSSRRERYAGPVTDFKEKFGYRPEVKLDYINDDGRKLCAKEAFRYLSHKFHGKGSGKNKTEKRQKKVEEEGLMNHMSSTDTPLKTLARLQDKQKELNSPFVVLSGGNKAMTSSSITKAK